MPDLADGESVAVQGSGRLPYILKNIGGVYSCSCPAWRHQSLPIDRRTCKHLRQWRGAAAEAERIGASVEAAPLQPSAKSAPALLLAETWDHARDVTDWWLSEKLDGVRAYWDGRRFLSRQGNVFHAPDWFTAGLPDWPLDGELWLARQAFQRTVSIVRRQQGGERWQDLRFRVFDAPAADGAFEDRIEFLRDAFARRPWPYAGVLPQARCCGLEHLRDELERALAAGGEGLMLREPGSRYEARRSATLLKVKRFQDAEARVIEHLPGSGRHRGRLGALLVRLADGTLFAVGTGFSDRQRDHPPPVGSVIAFRYQELTDGGVPRFPSFVGVRSDAALPLA